MKFYQFFGKDPQADANGLTIVIWGYDRNIAEQEAREYLEELGRDDVEIQLVDERDSSSSSIVYSNAESR